MLLFTLNLEIFASRFLPRKRPHFPTPPASEGQADELCSVTCGWKSYIPLSSLIHINLLCDPQHSLFSQLSAGFQCLRWLQKSHGAEADLRCLAPWMSGCSMSSPNHRYDFMWARNKCPVSFFFVYKILRQRSGNILCFYTYFNLMSIHLYLKWFS